MAAAASTTSSASSTEKENASGAAFVVDFGDKASGAGSSLQERFANYRKERAKAFRLREGKRAETRSQEVQSQLRRQFVEQCHKYIGVPYKQRYFEPGTPEYDAPLFLDCCGLVRRACRDLQESFGFRLGNGNQAYQYDTLIKSEVDSFEALEPGDLVFYAADYTNPKAKPQKHRMVHVEVFLGGETGRATIAARWKKGIVSVFDDFAFESKSWSGVELHFCKIDPWLRGECVTEHPHMWPSRSLEWIGEGRSVFADVEDNEDESADSDDDQDGAAAEEEAAAAAVSHE